MINNYKEHKVQENGINSLKCETIYLQKVRTLSDLIKTIDNYIYWYNNERIKLTLGGYSPVQYRLMNNEWYNIYKEPKVQENGISSNFIQDKEFMMKIARSKLRPIQLGIEEKYRIDLEFEDELKFVNYILDDADIAKGGRDILNAINDKLLDELAMFLFENKQDLLALRGQTILVKTNKDGLDFEFQVD